jgi:hypothetical protein
MKGSLDTNCKRYNLRGRSFVWPPAATLGHLHVARLLFHAHIQLHSYVTLTCIHIVVPEKCSLCEEDGVQEKKLGALAKHLIHEGGNEHPKSAQQPCQRNPSCWKKAIYSIHLKNVGCQFFLLHKNNFVLRDVRNKGRGYHKTKLQDAPCSPDNRAAGMANFEENL